MLLKASLKVLQTLKKYCDINTISITHFNRKVNILSRKSTPEISEVLNLSQKYKYRCNLNYNYIVTVANLKMKRIAIIVTTISRFLNLPVKRVRRT